MLSISLAAQAGQKDDMRLLEASSEGRTNEVRELLARHANVNVVLEKYGTSALMLACRSGRSAKVVHMLLEAGAKVNYADPILKETALMAATGSGNTNIITELLGRGAFVNVRNKCGTTPLLRARSVEREDIVKILLGNGARELTHVQKVDTLTRADAEMLTQEMERIRSAYLSWVGRNMSRAQNGYCPQWGDLEPYVPKELPVYARKGADMLGNPIGFGGRGIQLLSVSPATVHALTHLTGDEEETRRFWGELYPNELLTNGVPGRR